VAAQRYAAGGGYVLAAYKLRPWLEPVAKWERLRVELPGGARETAVTAGATAHAPDDRIRFQVDLVERRLSTTGSGAPSRRARELVAQLVAMY
jgi:hypothetical protein